MLQRRNAVGVVLLIAQGWLIPRQPWGSVRKENNTIGVELFPRKHGDSEGIHGGLIKKAQRRRYYASVSMSESIITNVTTTQRRRCCSFDSPGLARDKPTPGKHSQGDSTL